ncbi:glycosyltransferase family 2 protein [Glaciibacter psychrotolerans]|uniref:Glycosyltransferase n=1 Tax=Glaciibacter psychrotolerans TaxID=670054 RepID=A0A7Z0EEU3_9MICO|nr:hypothetical protein [Leifsonia psychrotolerans]NYJ20250.1 hypothetical protein [Leifsonia psychrotolerans]
MPLKAAVWRQCFRLFSRGYFRLERRIGTPLSDAVPLVICLWNRPERLAAILAELGAQDAAVPLRVILWNNQRRDHARYRRELRELAPSVDHDRMSVEFVGSPVNMGGVARFFVAAMVRHAGYRGPFIMLDDDEVVPTDFVSRLLAVAGPRIVAGFWSFRLDGSYWNREMLSDGERADYVGTGGSVCDIDIVAERDFFSTLPTPYAFMEDQWMSHYAQSRGWSLSKVDVDIEFVLDETNQAHGLVHLKEEFYTYLHRDDVR